MGNTGGIRSWPSHVRAICSLDSEAKPAMKPRIMLIGWLGAQKHHLDKCAAFAPSYALYWLTSQPRLRFGLLPDIMFSSAELLRR